MTQIKELTLFFCFPLMDLEGFFVTLEKERYSGLQLFSCLIQRIALDFYFSLLWLPFYRLMGLFVTTLFIKHVGSCKIIVMPETLNKEK